MHIETELLKEHSKQQALRIAGWVGKDTRRFNQLMKVFLTGEYRSTQRAAWVVGICAEGYPNIIQPYLKQIVKRMQQRDVHDAVRRNAVRMLRDVEIPRSLLGTVATVCFDFLSSAQEPIAVKVHSMNVLANIARKEPDIGKELRLVVAQQLPHGSPGFCACARNTLKALEKSEGSATRR